MKKIKAFFFVIFDHLRSLCLPEKPPYPIPEICETSMTAWAKREIEMACKREKEDVGDGYDMSDYGCACYQSALKAFMSLTEDGHSGFSIGLTKHILVRLIEGRPLSPIEDTDDEWSDVSHYEKEGLVGVKYQSKRMGSLFKDVREDGSYRYYDVDSSYCVDINTKNTYSNGFIRKEIVDKMFPITLPYMPGEPMKVYCEVFLTDPKNGDFDTRGIFYILKSGDGGKTEQIDINRFFKESDDGWAEITEPEYLGRKSASQKLLAEQAAKQAETGESNAEN